MRSSLKVQKALMVPHCISPPLFFVFVFIFWGCFFFFFAWENVASEILCSKLHKNSGGKQYNNHFKMLDDTVAQQPHSKKVVASLLTQGLSVWSLRVVLVVDFLCLTL